MNIEFINKISKPSEQRKLIQKNSKRHLLRWWSTAASLNGAEFCQFILFNGLQSTSEEILNQMVGKSENITVHVTEKDQQIQHKSSKSDLIFLR
jgi:hypothetical protein